MKHRIVYLAVIFLAGFMGVNTGYAQEGENLLTNEGLEDGVVEPWLSYMVDLEVVSELQGAAIPDVPYEGTYCLHAIVATVGGNYWERWIKPNNNELVFEGGKKYTFSVFMKSSEGNFRVRIKPEYNAQGYGSVEVQVTEEWQEYSATTPIMTSTLEGSDVALLIGYAEGDIWLDNARFYEGDYVAPIPPGQAKNPIPKDGTTDVTFKPTLSWKASELAVKHNVYLDMDFDSVNNGDVSARIAQELEGTAFSPGELAVGETYYWRVDGIGSSPATIYTGSVWSFTVEPATRPVTGITATSSSSLDYDYYGPEKTIDGSGLTGDLHSTLDTDMWMSDAGLPVWIQYEFTRPEMLDQMWVWNSNLGLEPWFKFGAQQVTVETSMDSVKWTALEGVDTIEQAPGLPDYAPNTMIDFGNTLAQYVKFNISSGYGQTPYVGLSEVRFYSVPVYAREPQPADGAVTDSLDVLLEWLSGREADTHTVLLSQDIDAVLDGSAVINTTTTPGIDLTAQGQSLDLGTTYYWQVVEDGDNSSYAGDIWSFIIPDTSIIDDMESYKDQEGKWIWAIWKDGYDDSENGAIVGNGDAPETEIVYEGLQAMPIIYDNSSALVSEANRTFEPSLDLTKGSPDNLSLYFRGNSDNDAQPIYLALTDSSNVRKVIKNDNPEATLVLNYEQWIIQLDGLSGLDLANIVTMTIGVGDPDSSQPSGAMGTLYVDNILVSRVGTD